MDTQLIQDEFARMGARVSIGPIPAQRFRTDRPFQIDVRTDGRGEFFEILLDPIRPAALEVVDVLPEQRRLLLTAATDLGFGAGHAAQRQAKYLCGHDGQSWFVIRVRGHGLSSADWTVEAPALVDAH